MDIKEVLDEKPPKICPICGKPFYQPYFVKTKLFCSRACNSKYWALKNKLKRLKLAKEKKIAEINKLAKRLEEIEKVMEKNRGDDHNARK